MCISIDFSCGEVNVESCSLLTTYNFLFLCTPAGCLGDKLSFCMSKIKTSVDGMMDLSDSG